MTAHDDAIDPVCGMTILKHQGTPRDHEGETYYLCSELCLVRFEQDAMAYVAVARIKPQGWGRTPKPGFLMPPDSDAGESPSH